LYAILECEIRLDTNLAFLDKEEEGYEQFMNYLL